MKSSVAVLISVTLFALLLQFRVQFLCLTNLEHQALMDEGVVVVVLGESFERWKASRMLEAAAGVGEV